MRRSIFSLTMLMMLSMSPFNHASAAVSCYGRVTQVYKWHFMNTISIRIELANGVTTPFVNMPSKSDEAMALTALASDRQVELYWSASDVTACSAGWSDNRPLEGYLRVFSN